MKWINVKKQLPKPNIPVLVFQPNEHPHLQKFVCAYDGSNWREFNTQDIEGEGMYEQLTWYDEITHWSELIQDPKN